MALKEYKPGTTFPGVIGRTAEVSKPAWPEPNRAKEGAPNVLFIVLDDTGFGHLGCYGSPIETPNIDALAADGLRYSNMHTTALCSPSRSCIITGRNHHSNHLACLTNGSTGYPGIRRLHPVRERLPLGDPPPEGLQHLLPRQVAPGPGGDDDGGRPLRPVAAGSRVRALLRLPGRRHPSVLSGAGSRQLADRAGKDPGGGLPPHRGPGREGQGDDRRRQAGRPEQAVLHVFRSWRDAFAAPRAQGVGGQVQGQVRRRLGRLPQAGLRKAEGARHHPRRTRCSPATIRMCRTGIRSRRTNAGSTRG